MACLRRTFERIRLFVSGPRRPLSLNVAVLPEASLSTTGRADADRQFRRFQRSLSLAPENVHDRTEVRFDFAESAWLDRIHLDPPAVIVIKDQQNRCHAGRRAGDRLRENSSSLDALFHQLLFVGLKIHAAILNPGDRERNGPLVLAFAGGNS